MQKAINGFQEFIELFLSFDENLKEEDERVFYAAILSSIAVKFAHKNQLIDNINFEEVQLAGALSRSNLSQQIASIFDRMNINTKLYEAHIAAILREIAQDLLKKSNHLSSAQVMRLKSVIR